MEQRTTVKLTMQKAETSSNVPTPSTEVEEDATSIYSRLTFIGRIKYACSKSFRKQVDAQELDRLARVEERMLQAQSKQKSEAAATLNKNIDEFNRGVEENAALLSYYSVDRQLRATSLPALINADINGLGTAKFRVADTEIKYGYSFSPKAPVSKEINMSYVDALRKYITPVETDCDLARHKMGDYAQKKIKEAACNGLEGQATLDNALQFCSTIHLCDPNNLPLINNYVDDLVEKGANPLEPICGNPENNAFLGCVSRGRFSAARKMLDSPYFVITDIDKINRYLHKIENKMNDENTTNKESALFLGQKFLTAMLTNERWEEIGEKNGRTEFKEVESGKTISVSSKFVNSKQTRDYDAKEINKKRARIDTLKQNNLGAFIQRQNALYYS